MARASLSIFARQEILHTRHLHSTFRSLSGKADLKEDCEITPLLPSQYRLPLEWSRGEGRLKGDLDFHLFATVDPHGLLAAKVGGQIVSVIAALNWDDKYASLGGFMSDPAFRGEGIGMKLFKHAVEHTGNRETCLFAVHDMMSKYHECGFQPDYQLTFYQLELGLACNKQRAESVDVVDLATVDFKAISHFNRLHFPASRDDFLKRWIFQPNSCALGVTRGRANQVVGFGVMRNFSKDVYGIGPLYAESVDIAATLLANFCRKKESGKISIAIPGNNKKAKALVEHFPFLPTKVETRMSTNVAPGKVSISTDGVYGITAPEIG